MADAPPPAIQECAACGALIDVSDEQPLSLKHCPTCGVAIRVRRIFDHFELLEILGAGGMGAVYRAMDRNLKRPVALKILRPEHSRNPELIKSLEAEAAITASVNHPHVVKVYSTGTDHGVFYIAMELVDKGSLDDLMGLQGQVAELQVLDVGLQIARGLDAAYQRGLIHRDIKPGNILFADAHTSKIVDFGLAVLQMQAGHVDGEVWGTPYYVAPEKLDQPPREDCRSDMYSLAATLFHALAGRPMFEADTVSMVTLKHLKSQAVSLQAFAPHVSSSTAYVIDKTLSKDPNQRYSTYAELIEHLDYARGELLASQREALTEQRAGKEEKRLSWVTFIVVSVVVAAGVLFLLVHDHFGAGTAAPVVPSAALPAENGTLNSAYMDARSMLAAGKFGEAAVAFKALDAESSPQPLKNWISLHAALAYLLTDQLALAQAEFEKIDQRGIYTTDAASQKIANFFVDLAQVASSSAIVPSTAAKDYDHTTYEAFALLLLAAKDWQLAAFDEAGPLFKQFQAAVPGGEDTWVNDYKTIAAPYVGDFNKYRAAATAAQHAVSLAEKKTALAEIHTARGKLKLRGKLIDLFDGFEGRLEKQIRTEEETAARQQAEMIAADEKVMAPTLARMNSLCAYFKFPEAEQAVAAAAVSSEKGKAERAAVLKRMEWLCKFKKTLINDINTVGYSKPVLRRNGSNIPDGLRSASEAQAEMITRFGKVPVPWTDLPVESIVTLAETFLHAAPDAADRQWLLGVYLVTMGHKTEGTALLQQAAAAKAEYQPHLALFADAPPAAP